jgi:threonine dehydrogenase-like Zn-dependent dehydrogenase
MTKEIDWKTIAIELGQRVNFAIQHLDARSGWMFDAKAEQFVHWHDYFADAMEMLPDVKIDREILLTMRLPKRQGNKARKEIKERRTKETKETL